MQIFDTSIHAQEIVKLFAAHDSILVAAHASPDGDAIGATGALGFLLQALGKKFALYNATGMPSYLDWVSLPSVLHTRLADVPFKPQLLVALDSGDAWRLGKELSEALPSIPSVNIDHHVSNPAYGSLYNWIEPQMAATGQMIAALADSADVSLTDSLAACVYLALVSDTGSFTHGNTDAAVLRLAARLIENGLDAAALRDTLDNQWTLQKMHLWGTLSTRIQLEKDGMVAVCQVSLKELAEFGCTKEALEGFVEHLRRLKGVRIALLVREDSPKRSKASLRSSGSTDVRVVAELFGGGGHRNAAGVTLHNSLEQATQQILDALYID